VLYVVAIIRTKTNAKFKLRLKAPKGLCQAKMSCFARPLITDLLKWHDEDSSPKLKWESSALMLTFPTLNRAYYLTISLIPKRLRPPTMINAIPTEYPAQREREALTTVSP
jgi:hypothetical protein